MYGPSFNERLYFVQREAVVLARYRHELRIRRAAYKLHMNARFGKLGSSFAGANHAMTALGKAFDEMYKLIVQNRK